MSSRPSGSSLGGNRTRRRGTRDGPERNNDGNTGTERDVHAPMAERRAAHERLSTGGSPAGCAPARRIPGASSSPGSASSPPDPPRQDGRRQPQGRVRDSGLGHPESDRPDRGRVRRGAGRRPEPRRSPRPKASGSTRPSVEAAIPRRSIAQLQSPEFKPTGGRGRPRPASAILQPGHVLRRRPDRLRRGAVRPRHLRGGPRGGRGGAGRRSRDGRAGRRHRGVQRRRRVPADRAGDAGAARPARGAHRPAHRLPHARGDVDPHRSRDHGAHDARSCSSSSSPGSPTSTRSRRCSCR